VRYANKANTDELKVKISDCQKTELEDLYLPYRPKDGHGQRLPEKRLGAAGGVHQVAEQSQCNFCVP